MTILLARLLCWLHDSRALIEIPSAVLGNGAGITPQESDSTSFTNLAASATVTIGPFSIQYAPIFDLFLFADQILTVQPQVRYATSGSGSTWRSAGEVFAMVATNQALIVTGLRLPSLLAQFIVTNTGAAATTTLEAIVVNRSVT